MDYDVISLYREIAPVQVDKQLIIYAKSAVDVKSSPSLSWDIWLGMFKSYQSGIIVKDEIYEQLRQILVYLFGEETVNFMEKIPLQGLQVWGPKNG